MQVCLIVLTLLVALASTRVVPSPNTPRDSVADTYDFHVTEVDDFASDWEKPAVAGTHADTAWDKAVEQGRKLYIAMRTKDSAARWFFKEYPNFAETIQSPFDGDLRAELKQWGYKDDEELSKTIENDCDFDTYHGMKAAFDELGLDTRAKRDGGPNKCFRMDHQDGANIKRKEDNTLPGMPNQYYEVCGKEYRATGGTFEFAANPSGAVVLSNVISPAWSAKSPSMWGRMARTDELPHLRATSDIAWGVWNRVASGNLQAIKYLMVTNIVNAGTRDLVRGALATLDPPQTENKVWPGNEFSMESAGGQALLGSPVGRWAGYFLMQHKAKLGGNRYISKVRVFKTKGFFPYLVFYVDPAPVPDANFAPGPEATPLLSSGMKCVDSCVIDDSTVQMARKSVDGKSVVREHVIRA